MVTGQPFHSRARSVLLSLAVAFLLALAGCGEATPTVGGSATPTPTASAPTSTPTTPPSTATATPGQAGYPVKVYFSKKPDSLNDYNAVFPVNRVSPTSGVATYALQQLIAGPTTNERSAGYFSEVKSLFTGPSQCAGAADFTIALNMRGSKAEQGTATMTFCRPTQSPGTGTDARVLAELDHTLLQFSTIKQVVVLTVDGACFGDESGENRCLS